MMTATLTITKKDRKNPSETWTLHGRTQKELTSRAQDTITKTLRTAQQEAKNGDRTRLNNLRGAAIEVTIRNARGQKTGGWSYRPTVR